MHFLDGLSDGSDLLVVKENGLRQLKFQDIVRYTEAGGDSGKGIQKAGVPEMLAGQVDRNRHKRQTGLFPSLHGSAYLFKHIEVQPAYFSIALKKGYEFRWEDDSPLRMVPAHQGFGSFQQVALKADFRLQINLEMPVFNGILKQCV